MAEFVNVKGEAVGVSVRDAVLVVQPGAYHKSREVKTADMGLVTYHSICVPTKGSVRGEYDQWIGTGASELCAWRDAWRALLEEVK